MLLFPEIHFRISDFGDFCEMRLANKFESVSWLLRDNDLNENNNTRLWVSIHKCLVNKFYVLTIELLNLSTTLFHIIFNCSFVVGTLQLIMFQSLPLKNILKKFYNKNTNTQSLNGRNNIHTFLRHT